MYFGREAALDKRMHKTACMHALVLLPDGTGYDSTM